MPGWDCSGGIPFFFDFDEDDGEDGGSGSLPLVDVPTRARAEGMLSAMSKAEELQEWQKMCGHQSIVDDPDYCSAADDEYAEGGGLLRPCNSKLGSLVDLTNKTEEVVRMMSTPPPKSGFVSEATKVANASVALVNLAGKCMLHVTGRVPEPAASSESADAHGGARGVDRPLPHGEGGGGACPPCGSLRGAFFCAADSDQEQDDTFFAAADKDEEDFTHKSQPFWSQEVLYGPDSGVGQLSPKDAQERRELGAANSKRASDEALVRAAGKRMWRDEQARQRADAEAKAVADEVLAQRGTGLDPARVSQHEQYCKQAKRARRRAAKARAGIGETPRGDQTRERAMAEIKAGAGGAPAVHTRGATEVEAMTGTGGALPPANPSL